jgi:threonine 3-dehydrogenase
MKALVKAKPEVGIWMQDVPIPHVGANEVLIKIKKTAICGTDIHIYNWDEWSQKRLTLPLVAGHEFVGEIVEIGKEVHANFKIGDRVSGEGHIPCGYCRNCRNGRAHICRKDISLGVTRQGCFAEYVAIPATNVYPIPVAISDNQAAILDPLGNAAHTALSFDLVGEDVLITGAGPVGIMAAAIAQHVGARHVVITDVNEYRLSLAKQMGITLAINPTQTSLKQIMDQLAMQEGFSIGMEMSGNAHAFKDMIQALGHGGKISLLGFLPNNTEMDWSQFILKGLMMKGIFGREMYNTWYKMIAMLESGLNILPIITHEFPIDEFEQGFEIMRTGQSGKIILNWD